MEVIKSFLHSRKFWIFVSGLLMLLGSSLQDGFVSGDEMNKLLALAGTYIFSVAFEDGMSRRGGAGELLPATELKVGEVVETKTQSTVEKSNA